SEAFNYKKYYSLILLAIADADYCFTAIDVGAYGSNSDSSVFKNSNFGKRFLNNQMHLPESATLPDYEEVGPLPFVFVGDEAFPLMEHLMRPYPN
ncbi:transposase family protein, partial [Pseudomonas aeruginosa]